MAFSYLLLERTSFRKILSVLLNPVSGSTITGTPERLPAGFAFTVALSLVASPLLSLQAKILYMIGKFLPFYENCVSWFAHCSCTYNMAIAIDFI